MANEEYQKKNGIKVNRSNSFEYLKAEFEQNLQEIMNLVGDSEHKILGNVQNFKNAMKINESYSEMFEFRLMALKERYNAQKDQLDLLNKDDDGNDITDQMKEEMNYGLEDWYKSEMEAMDDEKKKITKGWFTLIEAVRKIKRDLDFTHEMKKGISLKNKSFKMADLKLFGIIGRSPNSPTNRHNLDGQRKKTHDRISPLLSPSNNNDSGFMNSKIISDPNLRSLKLKQGVVLRKDGEVVKTLESIDSKKSDSDYNIRDKHYNNIEISDAKKEIIREIEEKKGIDNDGSLRKNKLNPKEGSPFRSPPNPSMDSSNLYNISPTSIKKQQSKNASSNKLRSTNKSDVPNDIKSRVDDALIFIKDKSEAEFKESAFKDEDEVIIQENFEKSVSDHDDNEIMNHLEEHGFIEDIDDELPIGHQDAIMIEDNNHLKDSDDDPIQAVRKEEEKRKKLMKTQHLENDEYLNDLTQGIGFDSQVIKHDFEDMKKSSFALDDFASMSDSDRDMDHHKTDTVNNNTSDQEIDQREITVQNINLISDEILDLIITDTVAEIFHVLENDSEIEYDRDGNIDQQIFLQDGNNHLMHSGDNQMMQRMLQRRCGIRVNFNAVKEYLSILCNFIKNLDDDTKTDIIIKLSRPYGLSPTEKLAVFHEGYDENSGGLSTGRI